MQNQKKCAEEKWERVCERLDVRDEESLKETFKVGDKVKLSSYTIMAFVTTRMEMRDQRYNTGEFFDPPFWIGSTEEDFELERKLEKVFGVVREVGDGGCYVRWENSPIGLKYGVWSKDEIEHY